MRAINSALARYVIEPPPTDEAGLATWAHNQLIALSIYLQSVADGQLEKQTAAPDKLRAGMKRYAGTGWDPGNGEGLYFYDDQWNVIHMTGRGGAVTQATSKSTAVTLDKDTGEITMNGAALNAATIVSFTLTNSTIGAKDLLVLNHASAGTAGAYSLNAQCAAGSASINVRNNTAGSLSEAIVIRFTRIPGATS